MARTSIEAAAAGQRAARVAATTLERRDDAETARADALPWLTGTRIGRRFLAAGRPRALARGEPAGHCPSAALAAPSPVEGAAVAVAQALRGCLDRLAGAFPGCGCRLIAYDDVVAVPREDLSYATNVEARLRVPSLGLDALLVAEDEPGGRVLLRGLRGVVGTVAFAEEAVRSRATVRLRGGPGGAAEEAGARVFEGRAEAVGWRRGRLARRIYAEDAEGRRLVLLIGFSPGALAAGEGAFLAWRGG